MKLATQIAISRDTATNWAAGNRVLGSGELGYDETGNVLKIGNGISRWLDLPGVVGVIDTSAFVKTINGTVPDESGNVTVLTGSSSVDDLQGATDLTKSFLKATDPQTARGLIGAGSSDLTLGTGSGMAADAQVVTDLLVSKADLGIDGLVIPSQLPSYVDAIVEVASYGNLPVPGSTGKIYVTKDTNYQYRWGGTSYVQLIASPGSTDDIPEGSINQYFTASRAQSAVTKTTVGLSNVDNTSDANKPVSTATLAALNAKVPTSRKINNKDLTADFSLSAADVGAADATSTANSLAAKVSRAGTDPVRLWPASTVFPTVGVQVGDLFPLITGS